MTDDAQQLSRFVASGDEEAFRSVVTRHFGLVYSTALRHLNGDAHLAEDVAQIVFTDLARKARFLSKHLVLAGWLYSATRLAAANVVRGERRRRTREQEAMAMQQRDVEPPVDWERLRPVLDSALSKLSPRDRNAVLLHYFERLDFRSVGGLLGISSEAAQKRASRALAKLRDILTRGGVMTSTSSLAGLLSAAGLQAFPPGLAVSIATTSLAGAVAAGPASATAVLADVLGTLRAKLVGAALAVLLVGATTVHLVHEVDAANQRRFRPISLLNFYNGSLKSGWTPAYGKENNLAALGQGKHFLKGVPFDIGGVLQLQSELFQQRGYALPESVKGIPATWVANKIHLLHANSGFADPVGTTVARLVLHYSDGDQATLLIRQQIDLLDWWEWPLAKVKSPEGPNTVVGWRGRNAAADSEGATLRLFETTFLNPKPAQEISSIDYVSAMTNGAPFLVAITLER